MLIITLKNEFFIKVINVLTQKCVCACVSLATRPRSIRTFHKILLLLSNQDDEMLRACSMQEK